MKGRKLRSDKEGHTWKILRNSREEPFHRVPSLLSDGLLYLPAQKMIAIQNFERDTLIVSIGLILDR